MILRGAALGCLLGLLLVGTTHAGEMLAYGKVLRVLPISSRHEVVELAEACRTRKPPPSDLVALLAWDLRSRCPSSLRTVDIVESYRVYFQWEGRVYHTVVGDRPGDTIPLKVTLH